MPTAPALPQVRCDFIDWLDDIVAGDRLCLIHRGHFEHAMPCPDQPDRIKTINDTGPERPPTTPAPAPVQPDPETPQEAATV